MEKQSYLSTRQVITTLVVTRMLFSTAHFIELHAGRSIQDVLPALPVAFLLNLITALPLLALLKFHVGKDPVECATNIFGRGAGIVTGSFYFLFFGMNVWLTQVTFQYYFVDSVNTDIKFYALFLPLLVLVVYAVYKGIESIARFGGIVFIIYMVIMVLLVITLVPSIRPSIGPRFLLPFFYNGPGIFLKEMMAQFSANTQIVSLAFFAPFLRSGIKLGNVYLKWNTITFVIMAVLFLLCVAVLGPFASSQFFPLQILSSESTVSVFDRLDSLFALAWMLNTVLTVIVDTYLQVQCIIKMGWNRHRLLLVAIVGVLNMLVVYLIQIQELTVHAVNMNFYWSGIAMVAMLVLPLILLIADRMKQRGKAANEAA